MTSTTTTSLDFKELISSSSKTIPGSEEDHSRLESMATLVSQSHRFRASNSEDLVYFIKDGLKYPFGPKTGGKAFEDTRSYSVHIRLRMTRN